VTGRRPFTQALAVRTPPLIEARFPGKGERSQLDIPKLKVESSGGRRKAPKAETYNPYLFDNI
jgi:hypothetical protein